MELTEGNKYTTQEMQEFFGVSNNNWKKNKDKLLLHLSHYYEYEIKHNERDRRRLDYIIHKKIRDYEQPKGKKARQDIIYCKKIIEVIERDNLQTAMNVSRIIKNDKEIVALNHKDGTIYEYTRVNMRSMFIDGVEGKLRGIIGEKIWCWLDKVHNVYVRLPEESIRYFYDKIHSYKNIQKKELLACIDYDNNLITKEEREAVVKESSLLCFLEAKTDFSIKYGHYPIKVPVYLLSAF